MSDLISKRELYRKIAETYNSGHLSWGANEIIKDIIGECDSVENKGDLISRQAILDELEKWDWQDLYLPIHFKQILDDVPSVENKGEWIYLDECANSGYYCSICHKKLVKDGWSDTVKKINFCPNCGADMRKAEKPETCKGCLEPCIMYEPDMRACKKKVREVIE